MIYTCMNVCMHAYMDGSSNGHQQCAQAHRALTAHTHTPTHTHHTYTNTITHVHNYTYTRMQKHTLTPTIIIHTHITYRRLGRENARRAGGMCHRRRQCGRHLSLRDRWCPRPHHRDIPLVHPVSACPCPGVTGLLVPTRSSSWPLTGSHSFCLPLP